MSSYDERLVALEQTSVSRIDFINAINKLTLQQAQNASDTYHEITILTGVIRSQGQDIKSIKERLDGFEQRFTSLEENLSDVSRLWSSVLPL